MMNLRMAGLTEGHQITSVMRPALTDRKDVVNLLHRSESAFLKTHLAQRVCRSIAVTDAFPCSAVFTVYIRGAFIFVILPALLFTVFLAKLSIGEIGAARIGTRTLWLAWHLFTSLGIRKASEGNSLEGSFIIFR